MVEKVEAVNEVDTSPEKIESEWRQIAIDESIDLSSPVSDIPEGMAGNIPEVDRSGAAEKLAGLLNYAFTYGFAFLVPAWQVTQDESANLAGAWSKVFAKYTPAKWLDFLPSSDGNSECIECDAVMITAAVVVPRINAQPEISPQVNNRTSEKQENNNEGFTPMKSTSEIEAEQKQ